MLVVIAGMKRSGTTWAYNIARVALTRAGVDFDISGSLAEAKRATGPMLLKSHWWRRDVERLATTVITSERNVEDVYHSLEHLWGRPPTGAEMAKIVEHYRRWRRVSDFHFPYRRLLDDPLGVATGIISSLHLDVDPAAVLAEVEAIEPPKEGQDPVTLYFSNHRA